ncbi:maleylpyruvate isomerase family mycothiol-dependent enzyme [Actinomadura logoneensis]|uniref:Maleylpyruvate isomerase family mycothiol-dependent enzyme n=2 Tax=Actinomadura logoneensis TaxID=2293572 RepID=A0A372JMV1_9ACTN|nr:maleylpyruvate isomerase family mycothiol-dependent enzyme [Actinomadura logoneensis]
MWTHERYCDETGQEAAAFATALEGADPDAPVPTCPGWTVRDLAHHLGMTQRWAEMLVRTLAPRRVPQSRAGQPPENDADLASWFAEGGTALVATLRAADPDAEMWSWAGDPHAGFWSRRMLFETAVHRADLFLALGRGFALTGETAADGVDEFLANLPYTTPFAPHVDRLRGDGQTLAFTAADTGDRWTVALDKDRFGWRRTSAADDVHADAAVRASTASDLYLFFWGRLTADRPGISVAGDGDLLARWVENSAI